MCDGGVAYTSNIPEGIKNLRNVHLVGVKSGPGTPFNLTEGAALLSLFGRLTGYTPRWFTYFIGDAHVYENHLDMLNEQLKREPLEAPKLVISDRVPEFAKTGKYEPEWLEKIEPSDFSLEGYEHHAPMTAPMAV